MRWAVLLLIACEHAAPTTPPPQPAPPAPPPDAPAPRIGDCNADSECELQSRCYRSQAPECVPHERWMEMLCGNNDPPDPSWKPETCGCRAHRCVVVSP